MSGLLPLKTEEEEGEWEKDRREVEKKGRKKGGKVGK